MADDLDELKRQRIHLLAELTRLRDVARKHGAATLELGMTAGELISRREAHPAQPEVIDALGAAVAAYDHDG